MSNMRELAALVETLTARGVTLDPELAKAIAAHDLIQRTATDDDLDLGKPVRDLTREEMREAITLNAVRAELSNGLGQGAMRLQAMLFGEGVELMTNDVSRILKVLRPGFDKAAAAVNAAVDAGIGPGMSADDVIALDANAIGAWSELPAHLSTLTAIATLRISLSEILGIPPAITRGQEVLGERVDYTACFTHPDSNVTAGYAAHDPHRWLSLSLSTGGRLRLNDVEETQTILYGEGTSPGWVITAPAAVIRDEEGHELMLYTGAWVPSWVDAEQVDRLIDAGFLTAARADAKRPPDQYPHGSENNPIPRSRSVFR